jgi:hypothetical protein
MRKISLDVGDKLIMINIDGEGWTDRLGLTKEEAEELGKQLFYEFGEISWT